MNPINHLSSLKRGATKYGPAPHKPILLLAVIQAIQVGDIIQNWIQPSGDLMLHFRNIWEKLVHTNHVPNFSLPFFHLKNEKGQFWELITFPGKKLPLTNSNSIKSYKALTECIAAAKLSDQLFIQLSDPIKREEIRQLILQTYFPNQNIDWQIQEQYTAQIQEEILYDPSENYARKIKKIITEKKKEEIEEELIIRSTTFRKAIKQIYKNQCAITGLKVNFKSNISLVDACHIQPFAETHDDTITNGIALSPTMHRAFDRGLIAISDNYEVLIHKNVLDQSPKNEFAQLHQQQIILPQDHRYLPSLQRLQNHRKRFNFQ